ncbi:MAG TPA: hypothetical protein VD794_12870 [Flavisolibacter sp.]|nr:hypothetical protein [Flavisolibacter sp.]
MASTAEYAWKDIEIVFLGRTIEQILEVEYDTEVEKKHIYGRGSKPTGVQSGNEKPTAQISIRQSELEALIRKCQEIKPGLKPIHISFDINITYRIEGGVDIVRDRIIGFNPTKMPKSMKQGDTDMQVKIPGLALDIQYNV